MSLLVDRIGAVIAVDPRAFETPPSTVAGVARDLIVGAYELDDHLLLELDTSRVISQMVTSG